MPSIRDIREKVHAVFDGEAVAICNSIIDGVAHQASQNITGGWSYQTIAGWTGANAADSMFQQCVSFLASSSKAKLLDIHFLAFDPTDPEDIGSFVDDEEVARAFQTGELYHPDTGEVLGDVAGSLLPYFDLADSVVMESQP